MAAHWQDQETQELQKLQRRRDWAAGIGCCGGHWTVIYGHGQLVERVGVFPDAETGDEQAVTKYLLKRDRMSRSSRTHRVALL